MHPASSRANSHLVLSLSLMSLTLPLQAQLEGDAVKTASGAPLKITCKSDGIIHEKPDPTSPGRPVETFEWFYVLPAGNGSTEKLKNGFYRVASAPRRDAELGWISQDIAIEWVHAQTVGFRKRTDRESVLFFISKEDVENYFKGDKSIQPISREPAQINEMQLFPLLDESELSCDIGKFPVYELAYLHAPAFRRDSSLATPPSSRQHNPSVTRQQLVKDFRLQVVFVLDTTASMTPWIEAIKEVIKHAAETIASDPVLNDRVDFGLVCFRDQLADQEQQAEMQYVVKTLCDLRTGKDHGVFQRILAEVHEADISSEDGPEDALAGLQAALDHSLGWSDTASKHVVLVSDASFQTDTSGYKNTLKLSIPAVCAMAQPTGLKSAFQAKVIHGLEVESYLAGDRDRRKEHFKAITAGEEYPGLHAFYSGPQDAEGFINSLASGLQAFAGITREVVTDQGDTLLKKGTSASGDPLGQFALGPVLEMLRVTEEAGTAEPTFSSGFAAVVDTQGNRALDAYVLVTHGRLALFSSALDFCIKALESAGDVGNRDVKKVVSSLQILATQVNLGEDVNADMPLASVLSLVLGFPVKNEIFSLTPAKLAAMTARDYEGWVGQVRASDTIVRTYLDNGAIWFWLGGKSGRPQDRHSFLKISDLP